MKAGIKTATDAARKFGWNENTYRSNENGSATFSFDTAGDYASKLGVRAEWLYRGAGGMTEEPRKPRLVAREVPLVSWVSAGQMRDAGDITDGDQVSVTFSGLPDGRYFATRVAGDSMDRFSPEGSVVIVNMDDRDPRAGRAYIFSLRGETTYKLYEDDPVTRLEPYSTNPTHKPIFPNGDRELTIVGRVVRTCLDLP